MKKYLNAAAALCSKADRAAKFTRNAKSNFQKSILFWFLLFASVSNLSRSYGQSLCPNNLNFSSGYGGWNYYTGTCSSDTTGPYTWTWTAEGPTPPSGETQIVTMSTTISSGGYDGGGVISSGYDIYGHFPVVPPPMAGFPASSQSLLLNGTIAVWTTSKAEYIFVPSEYSVKSLGYQYAVVLQNPDSGTGGFHSPNQMPRFGITAVDTVTGDTLGCVNFTYVSGVAAGSPVPFIRSTTRSDDDSYDAFYLPWQSGTIKLSDVPAGHAVRIDFMAGSCTREGHWGYAYIDMSCSSWPDTVYACYPGTDSLPVPPPGFETYDWYQGSTLIDTGRIPPLITVLSTPTLYTLAMAPYPGFGCPDTLTVMVMPLPSPVITGTLTVCKGLTTALSGSISGGTWSSTTTTVATISSGGIVTGIAAGTSTITYKLLSTGCYVTAVVTVNPLPDGINGDLVVCADSVTRLSDSTAGGTWSSSIISVATIGTSSGVVSGISAGTTTITYKLPTGCINTAILTVNPQPAAITGTAHVCVGLTTALSDAVPGGSWSSTNTAVGTIGTSGIVTGITGGTTTIYYTMTDGCGRASVVVSVNSLPAPIKGIDSVCAGSTRSLSDSVAGGTWSSSSTGIATVSSAGTVTGVSPGTVHITYTLTDGCGTVVTTVTVLATPAGITGITSLCPAGTTTLYDTTAGGYWASTNTSVATINASTGVVTGVATGIVTMYYILTDGCGIAYINDTVYAIPAPITGTAVLCAGTTTALSDTSSGGTWSSSLTSVATVSSTGVVTGVSGGTAVISYTLVGGCSPATIVVTVLPSASITGSDIVCEGATTVLGSSVSGGTWSSGTTTVATINPTTGLVTGIDTGTTVITYETPDGCPAAMITVTVTVDLTPSAISGTSPLCVGATTTLSDPNLGGTWTSAVSTIATVTPGTGVVTGVAAGPVYIQYTLSDGCRADFLMIVIASAGPISGTPLVCVGATTDLSDAVSGGAWISGNTAIATVSAVGGVVTGVDAGTTLITYTFEDGCPDSTIVVTVDPLPGTITGPTSLCVGATISITDTVAGGTWSFSTTGIVSLSTSGVLTGISAGVVTLSYSFPGCSPATFTVTVNPNPAAISGTNTICVGTSTVFTDSTSGGTWSSGNTLVATVDLVSGLVTGIGVGATFITYTMPGDCFVILKINVVSAPVPITGTDSVCVGATTVLIDGTHGGSWTSSDLGIATVDPLSGMVTGNAGGTAIITYTMHDGCFVTKTVTVDIPPVVPDITGPDTACIGGTITLSDALTGGTWFSTDNSIATVSSSGVVTGVSAGNVQIVYSVTNHCGTTSVIKIITVIGVPTVSPITGILGVCSGYTTALFDATSGGTWSTAATSIISISPTSGIVSGISSGSATVTYTVSNACGSDAATATVVVNMPPYITTNFLVACQTLATGGGDILPGTGTIVPDTGCLDVCDSSIVRYYANGNFGSVFTWGVVGGLVVGTYPPANDSIDILWPTLGTTGTLTLYDTFAHCINEAVGCIKVIAKPHAHFSAGVINACLGESVLFTDHSTSDSTSPIVSWYWNFGDGGSALSTNPSHTFTAVGTYTVTLTVKNGCGCSDSSSTVITISPYTGPAIQCASIVCDSARAIYSTPEACGTYNWSVIGGTILTPGYTSSASITVAWNDVGPSGFGYVSLAEPCSGICTDTVTIKVPVILQSPKISGPSVMCANQQYEFSLPLWAATQYRWGIPGHAEDVIGYRDNNTVVVEFSAPGTYTIHGWYQNELMLCGSSVDTTVTVVPPTAIVGATTICRGYKETYKFSDTTLSGSWTLSNDITGTVVASGSGTSFTHIFATPGVYLLTATGSFCANPLTIDVLTSPPQIDSVTGPDTVCLNTVYTYTAFADTSGTIYNWQAIGGTVSPASGVSKVNVIWTSSGTKKLIVYHMSTTPPYCTGPQDTISIVQENIAPAITGNIMPCSNSTTQDTCTYTRADEYSWAIYPAKAGSVTTGNYGRIISVLWNNVTTPTAAQIVVTVHKCDSAKTDTFNVEVQPSPEIYITASPSPACPNEPVFFSATSGGFSYNWNFGDGIGVTGNPVTHSFPLNTTTGNINYIVKLNVSPDGSASCPISGNAVYDIAVQPGPVAYASTAHLPYMCPPSDPALITGTVTNNVTGLSFQWYQASTLSAITGAVDTTYTATAVDGYYFEVTASDGCSAFSDTVRFTMKCSVASPPDSTTDGYDSSSGGTGCGVLTATSGDTCTTISLHGSTAGSSPIWIAKTTPTGGGAAGGSVPWVVNTISGYYNVTAEYGVPGIYHFIYVASLYGDCTDTVPKVDTIGIVANFRYKLFCGAGNTDSVQLVDYSAYLPWWDIDTITWDTSGVYVGSGRNLTIDLPIGHSYNITETVGGIRPGGTFSCEYTLPVAIPARPLANFTDSLSPICEYVPIRFTPTSTAGIVGYSWNFGDSSSNLLAPTQRTYTWNPLLGGNPQPDTVILTVSDSIGCAASDTQIVHIYHNTLNGGYIGNTAVCSNAVPDILAFLEEPGFGTPPFNYLWSNGSMSNLDSIYASGSYWITVTDATKCLHSSFPAENVKIINTPTALISGLQNYCVGQSVNLSGYAGPSVSYAWTNNTFADGTTAAISDMDTAGSYQYQLILSVTDSASGTTCYDTSATDSIHVYPLPPNPIVSGPTAVNCSTYSLLLSASEPASGTYNWSNATYGATNNINNGGPYRVWFTDLYGCVSSTDIYVPMSPDTYFPYFPTGCYTFCEQQFPITLTGVPDVSFSYWAWLLNGDTASSGTGLMSSYTLDSGGNYQWNLNNGLCGQASDTMSVTVVDCNQCQLDSLAVTSIACDTAPSGYILTITLFSPGAGATYTLGTNIGPIDPFSGTLPTEGPQPPMTLSFTALSIPPSGSVIVEVIYTLPLGVQCVKKDTVIVPSCAWEPERNSSTTGDSSNTTNDKQPTVATALLVAPNPASGQVSISYDYGASGNSGRSLSIIDITGRKMDYSMPVDVRGTWNLNINSWPSGVYIIRMEGDGQLLQTQKMVVSH